MQETPRFLSLSFSLRRDGGFSVLADGKINLWTRVYVVSQLRRISLGAFSRESVAKKENYASRVVDLLTELSVAFAASAVSTVPRAHPRSSHFAVVPYCETRARPYLMVNVQ